MGTTTPVVFLGYALIQTLLMCAVVVALCDLARRVFRLAHVAEKRAPVSRKGSAPTKESKGHPDSSESGCALDDLLAFCAAMLALGTLGYLSFWIAYASYAAFAVVKIVVLVGLLAHFGLIAWQRRLGGYRWVAEPLLFASLFFVIVTMLGFSDGGFASPIDTARYRFSHDLPADNGIPLSVAEALRTGNVTSPLFGDWLLSDRPPLQAGLYLLLVLQSGRTGYHVVASWLQATFLFGVWALVAAAGLSSASRRLILTACCLLPTALINTFYVWPKMLAAGYLLFAFALVFCRPIQSAAERTVFGILIGGMAALAMLSHGSSAFGLIGFAVAVVVFWAWPPFKTMIYAAATLLVLYIPWVLYQRFIDPPGDRLLKWHLAGVIDIDSRPFLVALRESYGALSWNEYLTARLANVAVMVGAWPGTLRALLLDGWSGHWPAEQLRLVDFFNLLPSLHGFSLALIAAVLLLPFVDAPQRGLALRMLVAIIATLGCFAILSFGAGTAVNHVGTYATQVLMTMFAFIVLSLRAPWLAYLFVALQGVTVAMLYAFTVKHDPALWPLLAIGAAATVTLAAYSLAPRFTRSS